MKNNAGKIFFLLVVCIPIILFFGGHQSDDSDDSEDFRGETILSYHDPEKRYSPKAACQIVRNHLRDLSPERFGDRLFNPPCSVLSLSATISNNYDINYAYAITWPSGLAARVVSDGVAGLKLAGVSPYGVLDSWNEYEQPIEKTDDEIGRECIELFERTVEGKDYRVIRIQHSETHSGGTISISYTAHDSEINNGKCLFDREKILKAHRKVWNETEYEKIYTVKSAFER